MSALDDVDVEALLDRIGALEERVGDLEAQLEDDKSSASSSGRFGDWRDQDVIDSLDAGQRVSLKSLEHSYRVEADLSSSKTIKSRIKSLTSAGPFQSIRHGVWEFTGGEDSE